MPLPSGSDLRKSWTFAISRQSMPILAESVRSQSDGQEGSVYSSLAPLYSGGEDEAQFLARMSAQNRRMMDGNDQAVARHVVERERRMTALQSNLANTGDITTWLYQKP